MRAYAILFVRSGGEKSASIVAFLPEKERRTMQWSQYFQNEEFLEKTRMGMLLPELREVIRSWLGLQEGMRVLDVGCGSGAYTRYLAEGMKDTEFQGLDNDPDFIASAERIEEERTEGRRIRYQTGDALALPYEDGSFDLVVSHTFLTSMPQYREALAQMRRVCRKGGRISSLSGMTFTSIPLDMGTYPAEYSWVGRYYELLNKVVGMYQHIVPYQEYSRGVPPTKMPRVFSEAGLKEVSVYPVGSFWSLSNAAVPVERKRRYLELDYVAETKHLQAVWELEEARQYLTEEEREEFLEILKRRRDDLLRDLGENQVWDWMGNGNLLVIGRSE